MRILNKTLLLFIVVLMTACSSLKQANSMPCVDIWDDEHQACVAGQQRKIINSLLSSNGEGLNIHLPGNNVIVPLNAAVSIRGLEFYKAEYVNAQERGIVHFNASRLLVLSQDSALNETKIYYIAPLIMSNQGSGIFDYIGLFEYDKVAKKSTHLDSKLLGNRIRIIDILVGKKGFLVKYYQHSKQQAYAEIPSEEVSVRFVTAGKPLALHKAMHPSWDRNNDGLNDCENDGSCDHTIDYTVEKPR